MNDINSIQVQHLNLPSLPLKARKQFPQIPAVYFAVSPSGDILYVGQARNLKDRWINHHRFEELSGFGFDVRIAWIKVADVKNLTAVEETMIDFFKPVLNGVQVDKTKLAINNAMFEVWLVSLIDRLMARGKITAPEEISMLQQMLDKYGNSKLGSVNCVENLNPVELLSLLAKHMKKWQH